MLTSLRTIVPVFIVLVGLSTYGFISAQFPAPSNPPTGNTAPPINESSTGQVKAGSLGVSGLTLNATIPSIIFNDEDATSSIRFRVNGGALRIISNRNGDTDWFNDGTDPVSITTGPTSASDFVTFSNQVRSPNYCDAAGGNCFTASEVAPLDTSGFINTGATTQTKTGHLVLSNTGPRIKLNDTDHRSSWIHANSNRFYILADRDNIGTDVSGWDGEHPLQIDIGSAFSGAGDFATFSNQIGVNSICERDGSNCTAPAAILDTTGTAQTKAGNLSATNFFASNVVRAANLCDAAGANCTAPAAILDTSATAQTKAGNLTVPIMVAQTQVRAAEYCNTAGTNCFTVAENDYRCTNVRETEAKSFLPTSPASNHPRIKCAWGDFNCMGNWCSANGWDSATIEAICVGTGCHFGCARQKEVCGFF